MKKSTQVAVGGLCSSLCLLLLFMTSMVPLSSYFFPAMAGVLLVVVAQENGTNTAVLVYVAASLLSSLMVPDREAVALFVLLFGYYPILKSKIDRLPRLIAFLIKFVLANAAIIVFYYVTLYVLGIPDILSEWGEFGNFAAWAALIMANGTFFIYDILLRQIIRLYLWQIRPKLLHHS